MWLMVPVGGKEEGSAWLVREDEGEGKGKNGLTKVVSGRGRLVVGSCVALEPEIKVILVISCITRAFMRISC